MKVTLQIQESKVLTVEELIIVLQKCPQKSRVFFDESVTKTDNTGDYTRLEGVEFVESRQYLADLSDDEIADTWTEVRLHKLKLTQKISRLKVIYEDNNFAQTLDDD